MPEARELIDTGTALQALADLLNDDRRLAAVTPQGIAVLLDRLGARLVALGAHLLDRPAQ